ncbi:uncharacterized protein LOC141811034 [Halichoeres trimaculatus]|uniref:uncharacterized protein LOC141811034 n=1 Tax=Halichoeres trimaculatus TaxID=147232 RepID=UPI003D9E7757
MATNTQQSGGRTRRGEAALRTGIHRENRPLKMLCSRCALPFLTLYFFLEEISAAVLPSRNKRDINLLDQDLFPRLPDRSDDGDLSVGDAGEMVRDSDSHRSHSESVFAPTENLLLQRQNHQYQYNRKTNEKRRKVAPLDSIGSFKMSNSRNRKDEPDEREEFMV